MLVSILSKLVPVPDLLDSSGFMVAVAVLVEKPAVCIKAFRRMWLLRISKWWSTHSAPTIIWTTPEPNLFILLVNFPYLVH